MQIPENGFGFKGAAPAQNTNIGNPGSATADAIQRFGAVGSDIADQRMRKKAEDDDALTRAKASKAIGDYELQIESVKQTTGQKLETGELPHDQAESAYKQAVEAIKPPDVPGMDPALREHFTGALQQISAKGELHIQGMADKARGAELQTTMSGVLNDINKKASFSGADVEGINKSLDAMDRDGHVAFGLEWPKVKQAAQENNWISSAKQRFMDSRDNGAALEQLAKDLSDSKGGYAEKLPADKRESLLLTVQNEQTRLENKAMALQAKAEARAVNTIGDINRQISSGIPSTPEMWDSWGEAMKGTQYEGQFKSLQQNEKEVQDVLRKPIGEQMQYVQSTESELMSKGGDMTKAGNVQRISQAIQQNVKTLQDAPLLYSQNRTGEQVKPLDFGALMQPNADISADMRDRVNTIKGMQKQNGNLVGMKPLLPQEADQLSSQLKSMPPQQQAVLLGNMRKSFDDPNAFVGAMSQIAKDEPIKALAGTLGAKQANLTVETHWFKPDKTLPSRDIAATILTGEHVLKENKDALIMPKDMDLQTEFDSYAGSAFNGNPQAKDLAFKASRAYYAGAVSAGEDPQKAIKESFRAVVGEVAEHGGAKVVAPYGMDASTFTGASRQAFTQALKKGGLPETLKDQFDAYQLEKVADGRYYVKTGRQYLPDAHGKPLMIDLSGGGE